MYQIITNDNVVTKLNHQASNFAIIKALLDNP
jgi:hypothetical protein